MDKMAVKDDVDELKHQILSTNASISVFAYKMDTYNEIKKFDEEDKVLGEMNNETSRLINSFTPEVAAGGPLKSKDILRLFDSINKSIVALRKQMTNLERSRLTENFNKMPRDIAYLTKTEAQLKRELCLAIDDAEDFLGI